MRTQPKTVSKIIYTAGPQKGEENSDKKKISYLLQKIFDLKKEKSEKEEKDKITSAQTYAQTDNKPEFGKAFLPKQEVRASEEQGLEESIKKQVTKKEEDRKKLENMVSNSNRLLISTKAIFPFDFFPNSINVEATRVNIIRRSLFFSNVHSVDIKDISNVFISQSLFFATLVIVSQTFAKNEIKISKLWKKNAIEVRRIIEGLRMIVKADIDMNNYSVEELTNKLKELSSTEIVL